MKFQNVSRLALITILALQLTPAPLAVADEATEDSQVPSELVFDGPLITLPQYLDQVKAQNLGLKANNFSTRANRLRAIEASLDFMPYLVGNANYTDNKQIQVSPLYGNETIKQTESLGVQEKFRTGTTVELSYNMTMNATKGAEPYVPSYGWYVGSPEISITQPLWKDFNASLSKANEEQKLAMLRNLEMTSQYAAQQVIYDAETAYWSLTLQREIVRYDREALERTAKILKYNTRRVKMNVADRSDLLQAQASMKAKELTYETDLEALRTATVQFNSVRNVTGDGVIERLQPISDYMKSEMPQELKRLAIRADVLASLANAADQRAQAKASKVKLQPDIEFVGTYQLTGHGTDVGTGAGNSFNGDAPVFSAGLTLSIPLDRGAVNDLNQGYEAQATAAEATAEKAKFDLDQDWFNLNKQLHEVLSRYKLAEELESLQREKLTYERERFSTGRTTSFQVLTFEDDFSNAELSKLRVENELISVRAKARLYNGEAK